MAPPPPLTGNSLGSYIIMNANIKGPHGSSCVNNSRDSNSSEFSHPLEGFALSEVAGEEFSSCEPGEYDVFVEVVVPSLRIRIFRLS